MKPHFEYFREINLMNIVKLKKSGRQCHLISFNFMAKCDIGNHFFLNLTILGAPKFAEQLNEALSIHVRKQ
jgi:hypothetical protein